MPPTETSEQTIQRFLSGYELGARLRAIRLRKKISLKDLGKHSGLSASMLSQIENGKAVPTLATLTRVAMVFEVGIEYFFVPPKAPPLFSIVRKADRMRFPDNPESADPAYFFECLAFPVRDKSMQCYLAEFTAGGCASGEHAHDGAELLYVTSGQVEIQHGGAWHSLAEGDAVYLDAAAPHAYRGGRENGGSAIVVTLPPF